MEIEVKLSEERFREGVSALEGMHGLEEELQRRADVLVFWFGPEILHEDACCDIDAKREEGTHLAN